MTHLDVVIESIRAYRIPIRTRVPLGFGSSSTSALDVLRYAVTVAAADGARATGWADVPLNTAWAWPECPNPKTAGDLSFTHAHRVAEHWVTRTSWGHPIRIALRAARRWDTIPDRLHALIESGIDLAVHDAYGRIHGVHSYETYGPPFLTSDLAELLHREELRGSFPSDYLRKTPATHVMAWHMVGTQDRLDDGGTFETDGYPADLRAWIHADGLLALKIKLDGTDLDAALNRVLEVARVAEKSTVQHLSLDFNATISEADGFERFWSRLVNAAPDTAARVRFVEEPWSGTTEIPREMVTEMNRRVPLLRDEMAGTPADLIRAVAGGWGGAVLKTCKGQSNTLLMLSLCRSWGLPVIVQDLTNPMLAQLTHAQLGAYSAAEWGVETNSMQFYPEASAPEAVIHPGVFVRRAGRIDVSTLRGAGFAYRGAERARQLGDAVFVVENRVAVATR